MNIHIHGRGGIGGEQRALTGLSVRGSRGRAAARNVDHVLVGVRVALAVKQQSHVGSRGGGSARDGLRQAACGHHLERARVPRVNCGHGTAPGGLTTDEQHLRNKTKKPPSEGLLNVHVSAYTSVCELCMVCSMCVCTLPLFLVDD